MRFIKFLVLFAVSTFIFSQASAAVTELNNQSVKQCRKQILSAPTANVVVAAYYAQCHWWQNFRPNFDNVSNSLNFPATYYRFDFLAAAPGVANKCLLMTPRYSPTILVYSKNKKGYSLTRSKSGYQSSQQAGSFISTSSR